MKPTGGQGKWAKPSLTGFGVVILLTILTVPAWADPYPGAAITQNHDPTVTEPGEVNVLNDVDFDTSVAFGSRVGYGLEAPLLDLAVTPPSFDLLRWPLLTSPEFPKGRLQPYLTVGSAPFIAQAEDSANLFPPDQSGTDTSVGVKVGAGVAWFLFRDISIFGEYRPAFELRDGAESVTLETDGNTHQIVGGISFRFQ